MTLRMGGHYILGCKKGVYPEENYMSCCCSPLSTQHQQSRGGGAHSMCCHCNQLYCSMVVVIVLHIVATPFWLLLGASLYTCKCKVCSFLHCHPPHGVLYLCTGLHLALDVDIHIPLQDAKDG